MSRPRISVFPEVLLRRPLPGQTRLPRLAAPGRDAGRRGRRALRRLLSRLRRGQPRPRAPRAAETGQISSLLCFSPDFTHPDAAERARQVERQKTAIDLCVALGIRFCRTLSGQRFPGLTRKDGVERTVEGIQRSLEYAEAQGVVLCMENHYKDGNWQYPEFAQPEDIFLEIIGRIDSPFFGVQYDPSNATVGGFDPVRFLEKVKQRVVSMHASDRYLVPGATLDDLRQIGRHASATPTSCGTARRARA